MMNLASITSEGTIGKYALHDFFLYHYLRNGFDTLKIKALAGQAFPELPDEEIKMTLAVFYRRFYSQQFKRSCMPNGPKIGIVSLSSRETVRCHLISLVLKLYNIVLRNRCLVYPGIYFCVKDYAIIRSGEGMGNDKISKRYLY